MPSRRPSPSSFTIVKMLYSLRRGFLPSIPQLSFSLRQLRRSRPVQIIWWTAVSSPFLFFLANETLQVMWVSGRSMTPFLNTDFHRTTARDAVLVNKWRTGGQLQRGDVVAFRTPHDPERMAVKRVVALEGDEVRRREDSAATGSTGRLRATSRRRAEELLRPWPAEEVVLVPPSHIWVEGDNPEGRFSRDSNTFGPIPQALVTGKVIAGIWPKWVWVRWEEWKKSDRVRESVGVEKIEVFSGKAFGPEDRNKKRKT